MAVQLMGLLGSSALYFGAVWLFFRVQARSIPTLPRDWRDHSELREAYEAALNVRLRSLFARPSKGWLAGAAGFVGTFAALAAADFSLGFELTYAGALAAIWTGQEIQHAVTETREVVQRYGLSPPPRRRWWTRSLALWGSWLLVWLGYLGAACFAGGLVANLLL